MLPLVITPILHQDGGLNAQISVSPWSLLFCCQKLGIVQKVFSEKASAIARMRQKCVKNASEMRLGLLGKRNVQNTSEIRQKCVKNARNTFGGEHLLDDTEKLTAISRRLRSKFGAPSDTHGLI